MCVGADRGVLFSKDVISFWASSPWGDLLRVKKEWVKGSWVVKAHKVVFVNGIGI